MESRANVCHSWWKTTILIVLTIVTVHVAECNYAALFDYKRQKYVNKQESFVVENEIKDINLDHPIFFYGVAYSQLHVSKDGIVSFGPDAVTFQRKLQRCIDFRELTSALDKPFIAAFSHDGYTSSNPKTYQGRLYISQNEKQDAFLDFLGGYLSHTTVTIDSFQPDLYVMVTWENVTDYNTKNKQKPACKANFFKPCPSATFQLVIAANSENTFLIFNYARMKITYNSTHMMGMSGGTGRGWTDVFRCVQTCLKSKICKVIPSMLPKLKGSGSYNNLSIGPNPNITEIRGRFIFLVSNEIIVRGGCVASRLVLNMDAVEAYPRYVSMLGGEIIKVSGRCSNPNSFIYCRFDEGDGVLAHWRSIHAKPHQSGPSQEGDSPIDASKPTHDPYPPIFTTGKTSFGMVGWCPVPHLTRNGPVKVEVSAYKTIWMVFIYIISIPPEMVSRLSDDPAMLPWFQRNASKLSISWDSSRLSEKENATVNIVLIQYKEANNSVAWVKIRVLEKNYPNTGLFSFQPNSNIKKYTCQRWCADDELAYVEIKLTKKYQKSATKNMYIAIGPLPLAWYVNHQHVIVYGEDWPQTKCKQWANREEKHKLWLRDLPPCPCNLQQALADWGRWQADVGCNLYSNKKCFYNAGAVHCVWSVQPTYSAAGSHCCYDRSSNLMNAADSYQGSTSSKAHPWGVYPYKKARTVPTMSHWLNDMIPYYYCCKWANEAYCKMYTDHRPTKDCRQYDPPGSAIMFGDPHVITFDDEYYHFGGAGDFWLVYSPVLSLQARFQERQDNAVLLFTNVLLPTFISSVAIRGTPGSHIVVVTKAPSDDHNGHRLVVVINNRHQYFPDEYMRLKFKGVTVVNNEFYAQSDYDRHYSNVSVMLDSGAGVQVAERHGVLNVVVAFPTLKKDKNNSVTGVACRGLLGTWDGKKSNEFMKRDNSCVLPSENNAVKFREFALTWAVQDKDKSLFGVKIPLPGRYPHVDLYPTYLDKMVGPMHREVSDKCGTSPRDYSDPCIHDIYVTGDSGLASDTRVAQNAFKSLRQSQKKIWSCGLLDIPFAIKDHTDYSAGNTLRVTGCREGLGSTGSVTGGPVKYKCIQKGTEHQPFWDPDVNSRLCTDYNTLCSTTVSIVVGAIILLIIIAFIIYRKSSAKRESHSKKKPSAQDDVDSHPGTDETVPEHEREEGEAFPMEEMHQNGEVYLMNGRDGESSV